MALSRLAGIAARVFNKYPLTCNSTIYGTFYVAAEFSQQRYNQKYSPEHPSMNYDALPKFAFVGGCVYSPMLYFWYSRVIDKYLVGKTPSLVFKKVVLDQGFMTPVLLIAFFTSMSILEGKEDIFAELREKFVKTFLANQVFWIPAQTLNFLLVPAQFRVVYQFLDNKMIETCSRRCMFFGTLCLGGLTIIVLILESQLADSLSGHRLRNRTFPTENNSTCYLHQPYTVVSECHPCSDFELRSKIIGVCVHTNFKEILKCENGEMVTRSCDRVAYLEERAFWKFTIWSFVIAAISSLVVMLRLRVLNHKAMRRARQLLNNGIM